MTKYQVVKAAELDAEKLTFEDLRCHFRTGRSYVISGTGRDRKTGYRTGIQTDVGDIEVSEWKMLMKDLIRRSDEEFLYKLLFQWVSQTTPWLHTKQEYITRRSGRAIMVLPAWTRHGIGRLGIRMRRDEISMDLFATGAGDCLIQRIG